MGLEMNLIGQIFRWSSPGSPPNEHFIGDYRMMEINVHLGAWRNEFKFDEYIRMNFSKSGPQLYFEPEEMIEIIGQLKSAPHGILDDPETRAETIFVLEKALDWYLNGAEDGYAHSVFYESHI